MLVSGMPTTATPRMLECDTASASLRSAWRSLQQQTQQPEQQSPQQPQESSSKDQSNGEDSRKQNGGADQPASGTAPGAPGQPAAKTDPGGDAFHAEQSVEVGEFYMKKGDLDAAADRFKEAIQYKPNLAKPHLLLAKIAEKKNDKAEAVQYYQEYLKILPETSEAKKVRKRIDELNAQIQSDKTQ
jgi:tetratricopeptide (TPR) repeat protein